MGYICTMEYSSAVKNKDIQKFADKWMELEKNHSEGGNPDSERRTGYVLTDKWILTVKDNHAAIHKPREAK